MAKIALSVDDATRFDRLFRILRWLALLALCAAYLQGGIDKALDLDAAVDEMTRFGLVPALPFAVISIAVELGVPILILSGYQRWLGGLILAGFTMMATIIANRFWQAEAGGQQAMANAFFEHVGLAGGFLLVAWLDIRERFMR